MTAKKPSDPADELAIAEREAMLETVAQIYIGMFSDLVRLKNPDPAQPVRTRGAGRNTPDTA
jgi:hypothetical protein